MRRADRNGVALPTREAGFTLPTREAGFTLSTREAGFTLPAREAGFTLPAREAGFTLIELLVALGVFAIAALALLRLEGASVARTADLDRRLLREVVAGNLAAETLSDPEPPALGVTSGTTRNMGRSFAWRREVAARSDLGVLMVTVTVSETTPGADGRPFALDFTRLPGR